MENARMTGDEMIVYTESLMYDDYEFDMLIKDMVGEIDDKDLFMDSINFSYRNKLLFISDNFKPPHKAIVTMSTKHKKYDIYQRDFSIDDRNNVLELVKRHNFYCAEMNAYMCRSQCVGLVVYHRKTNKLCAFALLSFTDNHTEIDYIFIAPEQRRKHLGKSMIMHIGFLQLINCDNVNMATKVKSPDSLKFFNSTGNFKVYRKRNGFLLLKNY
jgi:hypothetical protein